MLTKQKVKDQTILIFDLKCSKPSKGHDNHFYYFIIFEK